MKPDELREFLQQREVNFDEKGIQNGCQFCCEEGEIFSAYDTGEVVCQGKTTKLSKAVKEWKPTKTAKRAGEATSCSQCLRQSRTSAYSSYMVTIPSHAMLWNWCFAGQILNGRGG